MEDQSSSDKTEGQRACLRHVVVEDAANPQQFFFFKFIIITLFRTHSNFESLQRAIGSMESLACTESCLALSEENKQTTNEVGPQGA